MARKRMKVDNFTVVQPRGWSADFTRRKVRERVDAGDKRRAASNSCTVLFPAKRRGGSVSTMTQPVVRCEVEGGIKRAARRRTAKNPPCVSTSTKKFVARRRTGGCPAGARPATPKSRKRRRRR